ARRWLQPAAGRGSGSDAAFFQARPDLVLVARRAARVLRGEFVRFLDIAGNTLRRVTVDVPDADRPVVRLDVVDAGAPYGLTARAPRPRPALLGAVYPANPLGAANDVAMLRGARLAVQELNGRGGIAGRRVEHLTVAATAAGLLDAVTALTARGVDALMLGNF